MKATQIKIFLRVLACLLIIIYTYDLSINKITSGFVYLDFNDGLILLGCLTILVDFTYIKKILQSAWGIILKLLSLMKFKR